MGFRVVFIIAILGSFASLRAQAFDQHSFQYNNSIAVENFTNKGVVERSKRVLFVIADTARFSVNRGNIKMGRDKNFTIVIGHYGDPNVKQAFKDFAIEPIDVNLFYYVDSEFVLNKVGVTSKQQYDFFNTGAKEKLSITLRRKFYDVEVLTSEGCPHCAMLKRCLNENAIKHTEYDFFQHEAEREKFISKSGQPYTPQTMIDGRFIVVGFDRNRSLCERIKNFDF